MDGILTGIGARNGIPKKVSFVCEDLFVGSISVQSGVWSSREYLKCRLGPKWCGLGAKHTL